MDTYGRIGGSKAFPLISLHLAFETGFFTETGVCQLYWTASKPWQIFYCAGMFLSAGITGMGHIFWGLDSGP